MAEVKTITVWTDSQIKRPGTIVGAAKQVVFWGCLVGAEAASHLLFGGSWVVDVIVLAAAMLVVADRIGRLSGFKFDMSQNEIKRWAADGAPLDVKAWRESKMTLI